MRAALEAVRQATRPLESQDVARQVFERERLEDVTPAESASVRRALRTLAQRGEVEDLGRDWSRKRRKWATPEGAAQHAEFQRAFMAAYGLTAKGREASHAQGTAEDLP